MELRSLLRVAAALVAIAGCVAHSPPAAAPPHVQLEGVVVRAASDPLTGLSSYDPQLLFHLAGEAGRNGRLEDAATLYGRLLREFPSSALAVPSRFHLGLVREQQRRYEQAAAAYAAIADGAPSTEPERRTWIDAHFRLALCAGELGEPWRAVAAFDRLLAWDGLTDFDRLEALVGRGVALRRAGDLDAAEGAFGRALRLFEETAATNGRIQDRGLAAEAAFQAGEIAADRYASVRLEFPIEVLRERLERKCELLLAAQRWYLRAIRHGDGKAATAAGYRIGSLYETLYAVLVELEIPAELTPEQAEVYREEVRSRLKVLVKKAIVIYERSLLLGRSVAAAGEWLERLDAALARLRTVYLAEPSKATSTRGKREGA